MDSFLNLSSERRQQLCEFAGDLIGLDASSVEKDFWVCWILRELFTLPELGTHLTFKGGTSLSKGWKLIERFSEDIDMVIDRDFLGFDGEQAPDQASITRGEQTRRLDALRAACQTYIRDSFRSALLDRLRERLPDGLVWQLSEEATADGSTDLIFKYPSIFPAGQYLRPVVIISHGARSDIEPSESPTIQPYLSEALPDQLGESSFKIRTVAPERTFWEKAMLLHEETFRAGEAGPRVRLARHYYDLWCLIRAGIGDRAVESEGLFERVAAHRAVFFRKRREVVESIKRGTLRIIPLPEQTQSWKADYDQMREAMFFNEPPSFEEILSVVEKFEREFNSLA